MILYDVRHNNMPKDRKDAVHDLAMYVRTSMEKEGTYSAEGAKLHARNVCKLVPTMTPECNLVSYYKCHKPMILTDLLTRLENIIHTFNK